MAALCNLFGAIRGVKLFFFGGSPPPTRPPVRESRPATPLGWDGEVTVTYSSKRRRRKTAQRGTRRKVMKSTALKLRPWTYPKLMLMIVSARVTPGIALRFPRGGP
jgi:hypothetical protein